MKAKLQRNKEIPTIVTLMFTDNNKLYCLYEGNYKEISDYYYKNYEDFKYTTEELKIAIRDELNQTQKAIMEKAIELSILSKYLEEVTESNDTIGETRIL